MGIDAARDVLGAKRRPTSALEHSLVIPENNTLPLTNKSRVDPDKLKKLAEERLSKGGW
jgi:hypothetical protein